LLEETAPVDKGTEGELKGKRERGKMEKRGSKRGKQLSDDLQLVRPQGRRKKFETEWGRNTVHYNI